MNKEDKINLFLISKSNYFPDEKLPEIKNILNNMNDNQFFLLESLDLPNPQMVFFISLFFGILGVDRFLLGNILLGILKLITVGGFGIWYLIDLCIIIGVTRRHNFKCLVKYANKMQSCYSEEK